MMTFLPFADFKASAEALDTKRLQNQRTEARFVLEWLENRGFDLRAYGAARTATPCGDWSLPLWQTSVQCACASAQGPQGGQLWGEAVPAAGQVQGAGLGAASARRTGAASL